MIKGKIFNKKEGIYYNLPIKPYPCIKLLIKSTFHYYLRKQYNYELNTFFQGIWFYYNPPIVFAKTTLSEAKKQTRTGYLNYFKEFLLVTQEPVIIKFKVKVYD